jgi:hypothetical protein
MYQIDAQKRICQNGRSKCKAVPLLISGIDSAFFLFSLKEVVRFFILLDITSYLEIRFNRLGSLDIHPLNQTIFSLAASQKIWPSL